MESVQCEGQFLPSSPVEDSRGGSCSPCRPNLGITASVTEQNSYIGTMCTGSYTETNVEGGMEGETTPTSKSLRVLRA